LNDVENSHEATLVLLVLDLFDLVLLVVVIRVIDKSGTLSRA
jgi:hypothetical protein